MRHSVIHTRYITLKSFIEPDNSVCVVSLGLRCKLTFLTPWIPDSSGEWNGWIDHADGVTNVRVKARSGYLFYSMRDIRSKRSLFDLFQYSFIFSKMSMNLYKLIYSLKCFIFLQKLWIYEGFSVIKHSVKGKNE